MLNVSGLTKISSRFEAFLLKKKPLFLTQRETPVVFSISRGNKIILQIVSVKMVSQKYLELLFFSILLNHSCVPDDKML
ncbi:hypothetical protein PUN28_020053 [Cardiocondyla obscurior]|uniref:Uncharacterized protein n=1 Tax=Cardiocondyla obscurior TaxID=286306 RepID=A0AAW2EAD1_9HYME